MSLIKQLWIAITVVTTLALGGSLVVSTLSARHYLEQQLRVKNLDNATSLALSLTQLPKDPVTVELQVSAQFDAGHYRLIRLASPTGEVIEERVYSAAPAGAPEWFARLVPIDAAPGVAQVQDGWRQFGTLTLESHNRYAYEALWQGTLQQLLWFVIGGALTGLTGTLIIRHITRPLRGVVEQAEAIGGRRFVTTTEPGTTEFRSVVRAMNALSERVRTMLADESQRLEQLRRQTQHDELTGLLNRKQFMNVLDAALARDDAHAVGGLVITRLDDLAGLNRRLGHETTNRILRAVAGRLAALAASRPDWDVGRMNGTDFLLLAPGIDDVGSLAAELGASFPAALAEIPGAGATSLPMAATCYVAGEIRAHVLSRLDGALAMAEQAAGGDIKIVGHTGAAPLHSNLPAWRSELLQSLERDGVRLGRFPVVDREGRLLHLEAPMRLHLGGSWQDAGYFMPWVARLGLLPDFDAAVVRAALPDIAANGMALGINLSTEAICSARFRSELFGLLQENAATARQLWIDLPESAALRHPVEFRSLCVALRPLGCRLGIEHVGPHFARLTGLHELGLDYLKIDAAIVRDIDQDTGNQTFLRGLCLIAHSIGLMTIAEGVASDGERQTLAGLGVDAMTGPAIRPPDQPLPRRDDLPSAP